MRDTLGDVQSEIELSISHLRDNKGEVSAWIREAVEEHRRLQMKKSQFGDSRSPWLLGHAAEASDEIGPNQFVKVRKGQLDKLLKSIQTNQAEMESLRQKVEDRKQLSDSQFTRMKKSLVFKHDFQKDRPLVLTLH
mgnify:CR=1 FL=1